jgi:hypothetical protein
MPQPFRTPATRLGRILLPVALGGLAVGALVLLVPVHATIADGTAYDCGSPAFAWPGGSGRWQRDEARNFALQGPTPITPVTACKPEVGERFLLAGALVAATVTPALVWLLWVGLRAADDLWELRNRQ